MGKKPVGFFGAGWLYRLVGSLVGWLVCWLLGCLVGWWCTGGWLKLLIFFWGSLVVRHSQRWERW